MGGQRKALIVASDEYEQEGLRNLLAPAADAVALRRVLGDPQIGDFTVQVVHNKPSHVIYAQIEELFLEAKTDDVLLLHFSCHGLKSVSGELFFAARNTRPDRLGSTAISADFVQRCMRASRSRNVVLLLDCCYGGAFAQGVSVRASGDVNVLDSFPQEQEGGGRGRAVITASSAMEYAFEGDHLATDERRRPSVFTAALVEGLASGEADLDEDGWISVDELYDYIFDKVREQNPHQTPSRHIELGGELYLARSRRRRSRPASTSPSAQIVVTDSSTDIRSASAAEGSRTTPEKLPSSSASWREQVDTSRAPTVGLYSGPNENAGCNAALALAGWAVSAAWLAWAKEPHAWLAAAAAAGLASLVGIGLLGNARARFSLSLFATIPCIVIYIVSALTGTENWVVLGWISGSLLLYVLAVFAILFWQNTVKANPERRAAWERESRVIEAIKRTRWLTDNDPDRAVASLLDPLVIIPAARFACLTGEYFRFLAVVANRVTLGAFADWPPGEYTLLRGVSHEIYRDGHLFPGAAAELARIDAEAKEWLELLTGVYNKVQVVVVVRPHASSQEGGIVLHFSKDDDITVTTQDAFADVAGSFLAEYPYFSNQLNPQLLERLHSHLVADGQDLAASSPQELDPPSDAPTGSGIASADT